MSKNILYISQYYAPEIGAPSQRISELSKYWVNRGNKVTVTTSMPIHPDGIVHKNREISNAVAKLRITP